jgi:hypothetical protein
MLIDTGLYLTFIWLFIMPGIFTHRLVKDFLFENLSVSILPLRERLSLPAPL